MAIMGWDGKVEMRLVSPMSGTHPMILSGAAFDFEFNPSTQLYAKGQ